MSVTVNKCQVSYLEMLGTYTIAGIDMNLSGTEMSEYMTCSRITQQTYNGPSARF